MPKILIVEDDSAFSQMLARFLTKQGFAITTCTSLKEALTEIERTFFEIIISDVRLPQGDGVSLIAKVKAIAPATQMIMMTGFAEVKAAVSAMKKGAFDYISKPFTPDAILQIIREALNSDKNYKVPNGNVVSEHSNKILDLIVGQSEPSLALQQYVELVSPTQMSVLLTGASGTGKEVTARAIHNSSSRRDKKFVAVDCGAIPKEIATSEFFGHRKGSFTGAVGDKIGHFEAANMGTLFLDEIGNLSYENQVQLLRALQERCIKPVGSTKEVAVDVRIISATNEDLKKAVEEGKFREDLYHRLNEFTIAIPSLCDRGEDLFLFAEKFLTTANLEIGRNVEMISEKARKALMCYSWPGNLRELKNTIKRAVLFTEGRCLEFEALPNHVQAVLENDTGNPYFSKSNYEKERILTALKRTNFNKSKAAKLLNITRKTLYNKINLYQLDV